MGIMSFHLLRFASLEEAKRALGIGVVGYYQPDWDRQEQAIAGVYEGEEVDFRRLERPRLVYQGSKKAVEASEAAHTRWVKIRSLAAWERVHHIYDGGTRSTKRSFALKSGPEIGTGPIPTIVRIVHDGFTFLEGEDGFVYVPFSKDEG